LISYLAVIPTVLFVAWASGDRLSSFGLRGIAWRKALLITVLGFFVLRLTADGAVFLIKRTVPDIYVASRHIARVNVPRVSPDWGNRFVRTGLYLMGAFEEEFIWRGYFLARLTELLRNQWGALLVSSALFAAYHIYEGGVFVFIVFGHGILFGLIRIRSGSLVPGTLVHTLYNASLMFWRAGF
jgi:membrane protease YdiL (CAAX protease family)